MNNIVYITLPSPVTPVGGGFLDDKALGSVLKHGAATGAPAAK